MLSDGRTRDGSGVTPAPRQSRFVTCPCAPARRAAGHRRRDGRRPCRRTAAPGGQANFITPAAGVDHDRMRHIVIAAVDDEPGPAARISLRVLGAYWPK